MQNEPHTVRRAKASVAAPRISQVVRWTCYAFCFSLCYENFDPFGISASFTLTKMLGILFALACFWKMPDLFVRPHWTVRLLVGLWLWLAISTFIAELSYPVYRTAFRGALFAQAQCFVLYWLSLNVLRDRRTAANGLLAFVAGAALMGVLMKLGIGRAVMREGMFFERVSFLGANANLIAIWAGIATLVIVGLVTGNILRWGRWRYGLLIFVVLLLVVIIGSGSRGAAISLVLGMACFLLAAGSLDKRIFIGLAALGVCAGFFCLSKGSVLADRMMKTRETGSMAGREELWSAAIRMIEQKPLLGWGVWNSVNERGAGEIPRGDLQGMDPHNAFLAFFVFGGVFAGIPFVLLNLCWLYEAYLARRGPWGVLPLAVTVFIVSTMFKGGGIYVAKIPWIMLAFATAATLPNAQIRTRRLHPKNRRAASQRLRQPELLPEPVSISHGAPHRDSFPSFTDG